MQNQCYAIEIWIDDERKIFSDSHINIHVNRFLLICFMHYSGFCMLFNFDTNEKAIGLFDCVGFFAAQMNNKWDFLNLVYSFLLLFVLSKY